ncbi:unnamed protein product [Caenorhabditis sp. 36 PRJEB53466]|nr:unnamed protein product [Caenorhabditis sp. 36 PRJEB53466]
MALLDIQADLLQYFITAAVASVSGVAVAIACTIGHRENARKKDKSSRSKRSKRSKRGKKSQRSMRKKKAAPPSKEPPKKSSAEKEASARAKKEAAEKSARAKKESAEKSARAKKASAEKPPEKPADNDKSEKPADPAPSVKPKVISEYGTVPEKDPAVLAEIAAKQGEEKPESIMVLDGNIAGADKRLYGADAEAAVAEAKKQAEIERNTPKEGTDGGSKYL